jgi:hypothetical protein
MTTLLSTSQSRPVGALLAGALALGAPAISAQQASDERSGVAPRSDSVGGYRRELTPIATATRLLGAITIDGLLDDAIWQHAAPISDFLQTAPLEGQPVTERTEVRLVYDDDAIYVGARLYDRSSVTSRLARRDSGLGDSDSFVLLLDSYHDHETAYRFWTNPSGVKGDALLAGNRRGGGDSSWDPVWDLATAVTDSGWVVEMRIPFSQLRFDRDDEQVWGIQVERNIHRNQENATFPFTPRLERAGVARYAHLNGIQEIEPGRRLELLPYAVARGEYLQLDAPAGVAFRNPYRSGADHFAGSGLDLKYRIASNVTLDAAVNPDFGQVEVDPSVINLTAFETRFSERRPFFVEGADIFSFGEGGPTGSVGRPPQMLYSRRIGRAPRGSVPSEAVFSDVPNATTILGAAKITGRVGDGWSLGFLEAVTASETASYLDVDRQTGELAVEPTTNHFVGRIRRQIRGGATRFGVIGTAVNRDMGGTALAYRLHASAYSGGIDFAHETTDRVWMFSGLVAGSHVGGTADAIGRTQTSSARYYQRPDADHLEVDESATSLGGLYLMGFIGKQAGSFTMRNGVAFISPGFEANDLGFHSHADRLVFDTHYQYNQVQPGRIFRSWNTALGPDAVWNSAGDRVFANVNAMLNLTFLNYWSTSFRVQVDPWTDDDRLTRGGPMARSPGSFAGRVNLNSDSRRAAVARATYSWGSDDAGGWNRRVQFNLNARIKETLQISFGPSYSRSYSTAQYVRRIDDPLAGTTFGSRYVFADLDRTTLSLETRVNATFSPTLSLQLYVEPFVSAGDYGSLKEFRAPRTFDFLEYGADVGTVTRDVSGNSTIDPDGDGPAESFQIADRDLSYRSLLGNAVLRWEWRPGSTLFLVWQQRRVNSVTGQGPAGANSWVGTFDLGRDARDLFGVTADNILMIKVNYWLNP